MKKQILFSIVAIFFLFISSICSADTFFTWGTPTGEVIHYQVYFGPDQNNMIPLENGRFTNDVHEMPFSEMPIVVGERFYLYVTAINDYGESPASDVVEYLLQAEDVEPPSPVPNAKIVKIIVEIQ